MECTRKRGGWGEGGYKIGGGNGGIRSGNVFEAVSVNKNLIYLACIVQVHVHVQYLFLYFRTRTYESTGKDIVHVPVLFSGVNFGVGGSDRVLKCSMLTYM